jgi:nucleotide-binding universal stress UspA family protein
MGATVSVMRVLVATDFSESATAAIQEAHKRALEVGGRLAVCHVVSDAEALSERLHRRSPGNPFGALGARDKIGLELRGSLTAQTGRSEADLDVFVEEGTPHEEIVRRAAAWKSDLLVVGAGQTRMLGSVFSGVAEKVSRHAHCPVLVTRPSERSKCILVATDLSDPSLPAIVAGAREAERLGVRLSVIHVIDFAAAGAMGGLPMAVPGSASHLEIERAANQQLHEAMARLSVAGEAHVVEGPPAASILAMSETLWAGLLVVGSRGRTGLARILLGSVAEEVIRRAACSVLVVRLSA